MSSPGYRPRVYGRRRTGREWLAVETQKSAPLRKDAGESVVPVKEIGGSPLRNDMKKFEVDLDPKNLPTLAEIERRYIDAVLELERGNKAKTAEVLGIGRTTIYRKLGLRKG